MSSAAQQTLANVPSIDQLLRDTRSAALVAEFGRQQVTNCLREATDAFKLNARQAEDPIQRDAICETILSAVDSQLRDLNKQRLKRVFNLTGTVLHTNLGRAPLPPEAIEAMTQVAREATNLEYDLERGKRGDRDDHLEALICRLTGAEAATVVNNNAAAVLLVLNALANRKEVVVSRGELIEIGGSFRIPDVMLRAGAKLHEVGTTNRTHPQDFVDALSDKTALIMKVHASNYKVEGFTAEVPESELANIAHAHGLQFVNDLGSGTLVDLDRYGLPHEPTVGEAVADGADIVTFSGDKLLGGPQAGFIVGRKALITKIKKNAMKRALRVDKLTIAALEAVLKLYSDPDRLADRLPALRLLTRDLAEIESLARRLCASVGEVCGPQITVDVVPCRSQIGSGAQPVELLPSSAIRLSLNGKRGRGKNLERLADAFRHLPIPVVGRIDDGSLLFDLRCLETPDAFLAQLGHLDLSKVRL